MLYKSRITQNFGHISGFQRRAKTKLKRRERTDKSAKDKKRRQLLKRRQRKLSSHMKSALRSPILNLVTQVSSQHLTQRIPWDWYQGRSMGPLVVETLTTTVPHSFALSTLMISPRSSLNYAFPVSACCVGFWVWTRTHMHDHTTSASNIWKKLRYVDYY